ncbi:MAG: TRAP transporter large permease subunit [Hyphomonadaceae bacterium]|jgi:TRAP-type mannitol/chloroaromatic compound transport system permease large subunit|nr:TRAP transporter large permease subunit [Hyphomonadaceae bacterium]
MSAADIAGMLDIAMFLALIVALMMGYPVAFTLGGVALLFGALGMALGLFQPGFFAAFPQRVFGTMSNATLTAIPLFVLMGVILERSKIAEDLLSTMGDMFGRLRGGLLYSTTLVGALLAASTGVVGATVVTMGLLALPAMLARGYKVPVAAGSIAAAGTLGQIIPPSIVLILLGDVIGNANQRAAQVAGKPVDAVSVGDLFAGAIIPGLLLVGFYLAYQALVAWLDPKAAPAGDGVMPPLARVVGALVAPLALIMAVLGSILAGVATPTEGAAVGAAGAALLAGWRLERDAGRAGGLLARIVLAGGAGFVLLVALRLLVDTPALAGSGGPVGAAVIGLGGVLSVLAFAGVIGGLVALARSGGLTPALKSTAEINAMVFLILIGAAMFTLVFRGLGGDAWVAGMLEAVPGGLTGALLFTFGVMFVLGFFLDFIEICFVVVPLVAVPLIVMGADPVWLGVMMALVLQTSFLTPPFGFALFYLRGVAPADRVSTLDIYRGVVPFIGLQLLAVATVWFLPQLATWLPGVLYR